VGNTFSLRVITPAQVVFEGQATLVTVVTTEGEEGFFSRHAPFLTALKPGCTRANVVIDGMSGRLELATGEGFVYALPDSVTVLVEEASSP
jgi:F-type H+-transporting ATPase subunit epsilon